MEISRQAVALTLDDGYWLDVAEFEHPMVRGGTQEGRDALLSDEQARALSEALDLYWGDFLQGFHVESPAFEDWAEAERERLRRLVIEVLQTLVRYDRAHGYFANGIAQAARLLALDPLHDEINRQLILLLAESGQRGEALAHYETYRRRLEEDLGVDPPPELAALTRAIRAGQTGAPGVIAVAPPGRAANPYRGLRAFQEADAPDFFGREALVARLVARLAGDEPQALFLAVVGPRGCGKSSVVRAGLVPALRAGALPGSECWRFATFMPGAHPLDELAVAQQVFLRLVQLGYGTEDTRRRVTGGKSSRLRAGRKRLSRWWAV